MGYFYSNLERETEPNSLPNVEVWSARVGECVCGIMSPLFSAESEDCPECGLSRGLVPTGEEAFWFAFGFPGCLHDSDPEGPFDSEEEAITTAREE